jgi:hypothetical protein
MELFAAQSMSGVSVQGRLCDPVFPVTGSRVRTRYSIGPANQRCPERSSLRPTVMKRGGPYPTIVSVKLTETYRSPRLLVVKVQLTSPCRLRLQSKGALPLRANVRSGPYPTIKGNWPTGEPVDARAKMRRMWG